MIEFTVNRHRVEKVLRYLCKNNPAFIENKITIDDNLLSSLPENGMPSDLNILYNAENIFDQYIVDTGPIILENEQNTNNEIDDCINNFIPTDDDTPIQIDYMKNRINFPRNTSSPVNEFNTNSLASLLFPSLFPNGKGDPTTKGINFSLYHLK